ncbi:hypothetical protein PUN28_010604 [Cardiocondyla obscurior]|uniref:Uncharacterized protein n=1 Tax=Cardiocondyla obscurior TaxID=286306 RepID=A0AAW2FMC3_9HYME
MFDLESFCNVRINERNSCISFSFFFFLHFEPREYFPTMQLTFLIIRASQLSFLKIYLYLKRNRSRMSRIWSIDISIVHERDPNRASRDKRIWLSQLRKTELTG